MSNFNDTNQSVSVGGTARVYFDDNDHTIKGKGRHRKAKLDNGESDLTVVHSTEKSRVVRREVKFVDRTHDANNLSHQENVIISITHENGDAISAQRAKVLLDGALAWMQTAGYTEAFSIGLS